MYEGITEPSLLYGCETWVLNVRDRKRMEAVWMNCLRNICGLKRIDRVPNVEIRRMCGKNVSVSQRMDQGVLRWFGHVNSFLAFYPIALYLLLLMAQPLHPSRSPVVSQRVLSFHLLCFFSLQMIFFMPLPLMFTPLPMIQTYTNLLPSSASLPLMFVLSLVSLCLQLLTQICRAFLSEEPVI